MWVLSGLTLIILCHQSYFVWLEPPLAAGCKHWRKRIEIFHFNALSRTMCTSQTTRVKNNYRAKYLLLGISIPNGSGQWAER